MLVTSKMNDLKLPPNTPIQYEEGLWELCTDKAYEMMVHKRQFLDDETYNYQIEYWTNKIYEANSHLRGID